MEVAQRFPIDQSLQWHVIYLPHGKQGICVWCLLACCMLQVGAQCSTAGTSESSKRSQQVCEVFFPELVGHSLYSNPLVPSTWLLLLISSSSKRCALLHLPLICMLMITIEQGHKLLGWAEVKAGLGWAEVKVVGRNVQSVQLPPHQCAPHSR